jgi:hypothetical protein
MFVHVNESKSAPPNPRVDTLPFGVPASEPTAEEPKARAEKEAATPPMARYDRI